MPDDGELRRFGEGLSPKFQSVGLNDLALMATQLGRLSEALTLRQEDDARKERLDEPEGTSIGLQNTCALACDLGRLKQALSTAGGALAEAERAASEPERKNGLVSRANAAHLRGDISAARADFDAATSLENQPLLYSYRGQLQARHHLDLGD